ncbi:tRNA:m(4)X modification enzyme TRM13 homolog [Eucyclogobius newberryi]|uniref:tRNA:m(4)X modification enzyme TRM13 homolog n=1 Tax=Eucyclogobius newberryi TaxID=166745 RepID=UPI003B5CDD06
MAAPLPGRCAFFVLRKKRWCKMIVGKGKRFCGEHAAMEEGSGSRRMVCPLDPKHTVSEDKLEKHLKKCNSREKPKPVFYVENRNAGSGDEATTEQVSLSERSRTELFCLLDKLTAACKGLQCELEEKVLSHVALQEALENPKNGESAHKHLRQQASILAHMAVLGLLEGRRCFVEFGAGRGKLSHWIHEALRDEPELQVLLVERSSTRFKVDGKHTDEGVEFERLQIDIQHLDLGRVPLLRRKSLPVVGVGKHLCGAATDLALRCLLENPRSREAEEPPPKRLKSTGLSPDPAQTCSPAELGGPAPAVIGLTVALCCHHRCQWSHYVGKDFFTQRGLGADEFSAFCRMSSWATCGLRPTNQNPTPTNQPIKYEERQNEPNQREEDAHEPAEDADTMNEFLGSSERQRMGRLCKLLIDCGRLHFLKNKGFTGRLSRYVSSEVTLENVLLTAVPEEAEAEEEARPEEGEVRPAETQPICNSNNIQNELNR